MLKSFLSLTLGALISCAVFAEGKLVFAIDIVRHGDRTPLIDSPTMQKIWPQGLGQLTPKGMHQEYELGKKLRDYYVNRTHLLTAQYDTNTMNVRSSDMPRTLMSTQSILFGLYPLGSGPTLNSITPALPEGFQPIPIHTVPREQDSLLLPNYDKEKYKQLLETYVFNDPEWIQKDAQLKPFYAKWSKIAGYPITNLFELLHFNDRLFIEGLYGIPLSEGISEKEADLILESGKWTLLQMENNLSWASTVGRELATTIQHEINLAVEHKQPFKYILFVAHDTTIAAQLRLLGQQLTDLPPYAAQLHYELWEMGASNYEVKVTYLHEPLWIDACGDYTCSPSKFENQLSK